MFDLVGGEISYKSAKSVIGKDGKFITPCGPIEWIGDNKLSILDQLCFIVKMVWSSMQNYVPGSHPYYTLVAPHAVDQDTFDLVFRNSIHSHIGKLVSFDDKGLDEAIKVVRSHHAIGKIMLQL